ncbi:unnamed protein product [Paramecium primaurelia]|uniref:Transmembrane protein n=1 Tax=Paramecium primaurelia TaxID=5886 RepID=A0A8S1N5L0_PARPR|nr:unnamed protein product [Paramecium primaurelia]
MNRFSLEFKDKLMESKYQKTKKLKFQQVQKVQQIITILLLLIFLIVSALRHAWIPLTVGCFITIILLISIRMNLNRKQKSYYLNTILISVTFFNYFKAVQNVYTDNAINPNYLDGYMFALITISLIHQGSFMQKSFILGSIYITLQVFKPNQEELWKQITQFVFFLFLCLFQLYEIEKIQRQDYLQSLKHQKAEQQMINFCGITSYLISYQRDSNQILLTSNNEEEIVKFEDQQQFIMQIRNMRVLIKDQETQTNYLSQEGINQDAKMTLEKLLYYFLTCPEKLKEYMKQLSSESVIKLQGVLNQENYNIQILKYFDELPSAIILISQNKKDVFIEELKLRYKLFQQALETIDQIFSTQIKMSLVYLLALHKYQKIKPYNKNISYYKKVQSKIAKAYNDFQNIKDFFNLNSSFQRTIIQNFNLITFLDDILHEIQYYFYQSKQFTFQIKSRLKKETVCQDQKQLKQLILNILYFITERCQDITIYLEESDGPQSKLSFIRIRLEYQGLCFCKDSLKGLPFINPVTISELRHNTEKAYQLNLPMAVVIVRKLGPTNKIYIKQNKNGNSYLEFLIFRELYEDFHLMSLQSQHPINYLIMNTKSSVHGKHAAYLDLMALSPRIQLDKFEQL